MRAAAALLGWKFTIVNFGATPEQENAALSQAVGLHPDAIVQGGAAVSDILPSLAESKAAKIPVFSVSAADRPTGLSGNGIVSLLNGPSQVALVAKILDEWIVTDAHGAAPDVVIYNLPQYPIVTDAANDIKSTLHELCPNIKASVQGVSVTAISTTLPQTVVSNLQDDPKIGYAIFAIGEMSTGVRAALNTAGLSHIKIAGNDPNIPNLSALGNGSESAWVGEDSVILAWRAIDAVARYFETGTASVAAAAPLSEQLLLPGQYKPTGHDYVGYPNYVDAFKGLWHLNS
jgi:ABC-type sugar transport system substrate-binding protein